MDDLIAKHRLLTQEQIENRDKDMEARLRAYALELHEGGKRYTDDRVAHKARGAAQADGQLQHLIERQREDFKEHEAVQDTRHIQNLEAISDLKQKWAYAAGVAAVVIVLVQHYWK